MADEYIRKTDALDASKITYIECLYEDAEGYIEGEADEIPVVFKRDIEAIPAADVRLVVRGRWDANGRCSACRNRWNEYLHDGADDWGYFDPMPPFCLNCGADMRGDETAIS